MLKSRGAFCERTLFSHCAVCYAFENPAFCDPPALQSPGCHLGWRLTAGSTSLTNGYSLLHATRCSPRCSQAPDAEGHSPSASCCLACDLGCSQSQVDLKARIPASAECRGDSEQHRQNIHGPRDYRVLDCLLLAHFCVICRLKILLTVFGWGTYIGTSS